MIRKKEIIIIAVMIAVSIIAILIMRSSIGGSKAKVLVTFMGQTYGEYSLSKNQEIEITTEYGTNILKIKEGKAQMIEASCPDKICMYMNHLSEDSPGLIVCLPNKIVVELE